MSSAGGRQWDMPIGSLVIVTSAYRGEGTSQAYAPIAFPIVADLKVTTALIKACNRLSEVSILHSSSLYSRCLLYAG